MGWKRRTDDPVDRQTLRDVSDFLLPIRHVAQTGTALDYVRRENAGKRVFDIGVCKRSPTRFGWRGLAARAVALHLRIAAWSSIRCPR